jgi:hypothetical protein
MVGRRGLRRTCPHKEGQREFAKERTDSNDLDDDDGIVCEDLIGEGRTPVRDQFAPEDDVSNPRHVIPGTSFRGALHHRLEGAQVATEAVASAWHSPALVWAEVYRIGERMVPAPTSILAERQRIYSDNDDEQVRYDIHRGIGAMPALEGRCDQVAG